MSTALVLLETLVCIEKKLQNNWHYYIYCVDPPGEINMVSKIKAHISIVKGVMMENIEKIKYFGVFIKG